MNRKKFEIEIIVYLKNIQNLKDILDEYDRVTIIKSYEQFVEILEITDYIHPRIAIIDVDYLLNKELHIDANIKKDIMYKSTSLVAYGKDITVETKRYLYASDFKGIVEEKIADNKLVIHHVVRRANLYAATFENNFIRAMIECHNVEGEIKNLTYLFDYLMFHYNISDNDASNMRLVLVTLILAFKENNFTKFSKTLKIIFKSKEVNLLFKNYAKPKSFFGKIIATVLKINTKNSESSYYEDINIDMVPLDMQNDIQKFYDEKRLTISSYQDINFFWEQLNLFIFENYSKENFLTLEPMLNSIYVVLIQSLVHVNYFYVSLLLSDREHFEVKLIYIGNTNKFIKKYLKILMINEDNIFVKYENDNSLSVFFNKKDEEKKRSIEKKENIVNTSNIESMHYQEHEKISAVEFLKDYPIDQGLLDDLDENERDMKNILFFEDSFSQNILNKVSDVLNRYVRTLNESIEFRDLASSLESLSKVFESLNIENLSETQKETLMFYIQGLTNDLNNWKTHIFIESNTPDIHYLDASLLDNCSEIEKFILTPESEEFEDEDDFDDLEFF